MFPMNSSACSALPTMALSKSFLCTSVRPEVFQLCGETHYATESLGTGGCVEAIMAMERTRSLIATLLLFGRPVKAAAGASGSINGEIQTKYDACIKVRAMLDHPINDIEFFIV
jgi:hypothetical protein